MTWNVSVGLQLHIDYDDIEADDREEAETIAKERALEDIDYNNCTVDDCKDPLHQALDLINRKDSKIAELTEENNRQQAEIERLTEETMNMAITIETCQAEEIEEFVEMLKEKADVLLVGKNGNYYSVSDKDIDNLVKQRVGEENV